MRYLTLLVFAFLNCLALNADAAEKYFQGYRFEASIEPVSFWRSRYHEGFDGDESVVRVKEGDEYSIVVRNPLPVRVAATVTVDGLNTIDGKRTSAADGQKWIINPNSSITIRGWQTSDSDLRKFVFTREGASYANWKSHRDRRDYTENLGIIGVAYFWNSEELSHVLYPPEPYITQDCEMGKSESSLGRAPAAAAMPRRAFKEERAGTGMGRNEWNQVTRVNFYYDTGMYSSSDALTIRYDFGRPRPEPRPFEDPHWEYRYPGNYTPQMP